MHRWRTCRNWLTGIALRGLVPPKTWVFNSIFELLLVLNELRDAPQNEFLRLFASRQAVRKQTIDNVLQQPLGNWPEPFWAVLFGLQRVYQLEESAMKREMTVEDVMEIGAELRSPGDCQCNAGGASGWAGPEDRLAGLAPEEMAALLQQIEALLAKQPAEQPRHRKGSGKR